MEIAVWQEFILDPWIVELIVLFVQGSGNVQTSFWSKFGVIPQISN